MAKLFHTPEIFRAGAQPVNENDWFKLFQPLLLQIANTDRGRELLCIDKSLGDIDQIAKNYVRVPLGDGQYLSEFRVGAKYGNVIRYKWEEFKEFAKLFYEAEMFGRKLLMPLLQHPDTGRLMAAAATDTFYPDAHAESTSCDGLIRNFVGEGVSWATMHDASAGDYLSTELNYHGSVQLQAFSGNRVTSRYLIYRTFVLFDTSSIADSNSIDSAILAGHNAQTSYRYISDNDAQAYISIRITSPASNTDLVLDDFDQVGAEACDSDQHQDCDAVAFDTYIDWDLNATGLAEIDKTGISKFGWAEGHDLENVAHTQSGNQDTGMVIDGAENTGTDEDPKLSVTHSEVSFKPSTIII